MNESTLQEVAILKARKAAIDARLAALAPELETNPAVVGTELRMVGEAGRYGTATVVSDGKRYSRRYGDADAQALRDHLAPDLFEKFFVVREPSVKVDKKRVESLVKSDHPDVMARRAEFEALVAGLDTQHREAWDDANPVIHRFEVTPSEDLMEAMAEELQSEMTAICAADKPRIELADEPRRQVEVAVASGDGYQD